VKPDLRFRDAVNNDIEIVTHADRVLVFDHAIPAEGLRWRDLQAWWADVEDHKDASTAKKTLYRRLLKSLPAESPPQRLLFESFFRHFRDAVPNLPALLPEVWLHYDPKTVRQRGRFALLRQRMDFLLLISHGTRVVLEVDGVQHYSVENGKASPPVYAKMVAADRELRLCGYEVYRFGGSELQGKGGEQLVAKFFEDLFKKHRVLS
jgi:very-short-patch-repair endonuclease